MSRRVPRHLFNTGRGQREKGRRLTTTVAIIKTFNNNNYHNNKGQREKDRHLTTTITIITKDREKRTGV